VSSAAVAPGAAAFWLAGDRVTAAMNVNTWDVNADIRRLL
jgi:hypothetical protein